MKKIRKTLIAANWKMNKKVSEAQSFVESFLPLNRSINEVEIVICPPFTCLPYLSTALNGTVIEIGAQDVFWETEGAYTGEISTVMLQELNCRYVIVGHSERRQIIGESDLIINKKTKAVSSAGLIPILCVGETEEERKQMQAQTVVSRQLEEGLQDIVAGELVIAYEPVWAIGTGAHASQGDAQEMSSFIRHKLAQLYDATWAEGIRILYGGSVKPENIARFVGQPDVDGALVGGASLDAHDFARIVRLNRND